MPRAQMVPVVLSNLGMHLGQRSSTTWNWPCHTGDAHLGYAQDTHTHRDMQKLLKPTVLSSLTKAQASRARRWLSSRVSDLQGLEEEDMVMNVAHGA